MKMRKRRFRRKLVYYPAAGALALSSLFGVRKPEKIKTKEQSASTISLSAEGPSNLRRGVSDVIGSLGGESANASVVMSDGSAPGDLLEESFRRLQVAKQRWQQGKTSEAAIEADEVYMMLSGVPSSLEPQQSRIRDELRLELSRFVVQLNEAQAGSAIVSSGPIEQLAPIPMEINQQVQDEIAMFQTTQRQTFIQGYQLAGAHMPFIEKKLADRGMPKELGWLPLIESGFKTHAKSQVAALGLWQFMPATGDQMGLSRTRWVDNRMDPEQASEAAARGKKGKR